MTCPVVHAREKGVTRTRPVSGRPRFDRSRFSTKTTAQTVDSHTHVSVTSVLPVLGNIAPTPIAEVPNHYGSPATRPEIYVPGLRWPILSHTLITKSPFRFQTILNARRINCVPATQNDCAKLQPTRKRYSPFHLIRTRGALSTVFDSVYYRSGTAEKRDNVKLNHRTENAIWWQGEVEKTIFTVHLIGLFIAVW